MEPSNGSAKKSDVRSNGYVPGSQTKGYQGTGRIDPLAVVPPKNPGGAIKPAKAK